MLVGDNATSLRLLHYPAVENAHAGEAVVRCGEHTDYGGMTLLFQVKLSKNIHKLLCSKNR